MHLLLHPRVLPFRSSIACLSHFTGATVLSLIFCVNIAARVNWQLLLGVPQSGAHLEVAIESRLGALFTFFEVLTVVKGLLKIWRLGFHL